MGSEDLFHRRKAKQAKELTRKKAMRASYSKVLIVCEGEKTEPNYFNELKDHLMLNSATVKVTGECGSSPISVFEYSIRLFREARNAGDAYDKIFCVFDKDTHDSYEQTLLKIDSAKPKNTFVSITSVPCFEFWILLHFTYTTRQFQAAGNRSGCNQLITELRNFLPEYTKGDNLIFSRILAQLPQAKVFAERVLNETQVNQDDNPSTNVHELVDYLEKIKTAAHPYPDYQ